MIEPRQSGKNFLRAEEERGEEEDYLDELLEIRFLRLSEALHILIQNACACKQTNTPKQRKVTAGERERRARRSSIQIIVTRFLFGSFRHFFFFFFLSLCLDSPPYASPRPKVFVFVSPSTAGTSSPSFLALSLRLSFFVSFSRAVLFDEAEEEDKQNRFEWSFGEKERTGKAVARSGELE